MKDTEILKNNGINVEKGIELLGDIEMYDETLQDFLDEMEERLPNIEKYKQTSDLENYAILVHALKGDSNYLGFTKLAELALEHQLKSQENNLEYIETHYEELINETNRNIKIVKEYLSKK